MSLPQPSRAVIPSVERNSLSSSRTLSQLAQHVPSFPVRRHVLFKTPSNVAFVLPDENMSVFIPDSLALALDQSTPELCIM